MILVYGLAAVVGLFALGSLVGMWLKRQARHYPSVGGDDE